MAGAEGVERAHGRAVVIGASAGGVEALIEVIASLPVGFPAPILIVLHLSVTSRSVLPAILSHAGSLEALHPADGDPLRPGVVYVAPQGHHLLAVDERARLISGPSEHGMRPAIDPLFRSVARSYGSRAIGVVLSGTLEDGVAGLREVKRAGGIAIVQEPASAAFREMPSNALDAVEVDLVMPPAEIGRGLSSIVRWPAPEPPRAEEQTDGFETSIVCPQCGEAVREQASGALLVYRCTAGHTFTADTLPPVQSVNRATEQRSPAQDLRRRGELLERLSLQARQNGRAIAAERFRAQAIDVTEQADALELGGDGDEEQG